MLANTHRHGLPGLTRAETAPIDLGTEGHAVAPTFTSKLRGGGLSTVKEETTVTKLPKNDIPAVAPSSSTTQQRGHLSGNAIQDDVTAAMSRHKNKQRTLAAKSASNPYKSPPTSPRKSSQRKHEYTDEAERQQATEEYKRAAKKKKGGGALSGSAKLTNELTAVNTVRRNTEATQPLKVAPPIAAPPRRTPLDARCYELEQVNNALEKKNAALVMQLAQADARAMSATEALKSKSMIATDEADMLRKHMSEVDNLKSKLAQYTNSAGELDKKLRAAQEANENRTAAFHAAEREAEQKVTIALAAAEKWRTQAAVAQKQLTDATEEHQKTSRTTQQVCVLLQMRYHSLNAKLKKLSPAKVPIDEQDDGSEHSSHGLRGCSGTLELQAETHTAEATSSSRTAGHIISHASRILLGPNWTDPAEDCAVPTALSDSDCHMWCDPVTPSATPRSSQQQPFVQQLA